MKTSLIEPGAARALRNSYEEAIETARSSISEPPKAIIIDLNNLSLIDMHPIGILMILPQKYEDLPAGFVNVGERVMPTFKFLRQEKLSDIFESYGEATLYLSESWHDNLERIEDTLIGETLSNKW